MPSDKPNYTVPLTVHIPKDLQELLTFYTGRNGADLDDLAIAGLALFLRRDGQFALDMAKLKQTDPGQYALIGPIYEALPK